MESAKLMYSGLNTIGSVSREGLSVSLVGLFLGRSCPSHWVFESAGFGGFKWGPYRTMSLQLTSGSFRARRGHGNGGKFSSGVRRLLAEDGREPVQLCLQLCLEVSLPKANGLGYWLVQETVPTNVERPSHNFGLEAYRLP